MPSFFKIGQVILKKNILNIVNVFSPLRNYLPLGKGIFLHLNNNEYPLPKIALFGCLVVWLKLAQWFWRLKKISSMYFCYFVIIFLWKRAYPVIWTNLNPHRPRMLWLSGSEEEDTNVKNLRTDRLTTDDRWSEKLTWAFSSGELNILTMEILAALFI